MPGQPDRAEDNLHSVSHEAPRTVRMRTRELVARPVPIPSPHTPPFLLPSPLACWLGLRSDSP